jgi:hypothetical protein
VICRIRATARGLHPQAKGGSSTDHRERRFGVENKTESDSRRASLRDGFSRCESCRGRYRIRIWLRQGHDTRRGSHAAHPWRMACGGGMRPAYLRCRSNRGGSSQGGVKVPTGGKRPTFLKRYTCLKPASAFFASVRKGQQIRCDSEADGHSPDERERVPEGCVCARPAVRMP